MRVQFPAMPLWTYVYLDNVTCATFLFSPCLPCMHIISNIVCLLLGQDMAACTLCHRGILMRHAYSYAFLFSMEVGDRQGWDWRDRLPGDAYLSQTTADCLVSALCPFSLPLLFMPCISPTTSHCSCHSSFLVFSSPTCLIFPVPASSRASSLLVAHVCASLLLPTSPSSSSFSLNLYTIKLPTYAYHSIACLCILLPAHVRCEINSWLACTPAQHSVPP